MRVVQGFSERWGSGDVSLKGDLNSDRPIRTPADADVLDSRFSERYRSSGEFNRGKVFSSRMPNIVA